MLRSISIIILLACVWDVRAGLHTLGHPTRATLSRVVPSTHGLRFPSPSVAGRLMLSPANRVVPLGPPKLNYGSAAQAMLRDIIVQANGEANSTAVNIPVEQPTARTEDPAGKAIAVVTGAVSIVVGVLYLGAVALIGQLQGLPPPPEMFAKSFFSPSSLSIATFVALLVGSGIAFSLLRSGRRSLTLSKEPLLSMCS
eukprot:gnl/MRDRNA2_/MRDRNA2_31875_c0_seq1.p1 gnl/MRDRNA2_/MRDRNA2_31875_c0~~gnl/MRDRNA2_/MRDRNA2_31875_c0_seq1.p1  ORF type:complete len:198 (+),score=8.73 gnl/MRDRNA2_/MRDRNA2_31875_c0_seq1:70-663(+)